MEKGALRVGMLGGAFDPPHKGHMALADAAIRSLALDLLHVVPTGEAWHKTRSLTAAHHRLAMAELAFGALPGVVVDPVETRRSGPSYTIDTLTALREQYPSAALFLVLGADQAKAFTQWHRCDDILSFATICVAGRVDSTGVTGKILAEFLCGADWLKIDMPLQEASSTQIRSKIAAGADPSGLVFEPVARYIALHHLYRNQAS